MKNTLEVVKIGGHVLNDAQVRSDFLKGFAQIKGPRILVHGGGKAASEFAAQQGLTPQFHEGRRITTQADLDIVTMVYAGLINKQVVAQLQSFNCNALGLSGADGNCIQVERRPPQPVDFGFVGDVVAVDAQRFNEWLVLGLSPVCCAITHDGKGQLYNTNADTIASEIAVALQQFYQVRLTYCFEKPGVLSDVDDPDSVIPWIHPASFEQLKAEGKVHTGMIPKLSNCFAALRAGVQEVRIGGVQSLHADPFPGTTLSLSTPPQSISHAEL